MAAPEVLNLPTEVQLVFEVRPCQALRRTYEPGGQPHPCAYFGEWGAYHSSDYADAGPPPAPGIVQPMVYAGKTSLLPEILAGCRKAPILAVGINPQPARLVAENSERRQPPVRGLPPVRPLLPLPVDLEAPDPPAALR